MERDIEAEERYIKAVAEMNLVSVPPYQMRAPETKSQTLANKLREASELLLEAAEEIERLESDIYNAYDY